MEFGRRASSLAGQAERSQRGDQQRPAGARPERSRFDVVLKSARIASDLNQCFFVLRAQGRSGRQHGKGWAAMAQASSGRLQRSRLTS